MRDAIIHISYVKTDFNCPECKKTYYEEDYYKRLYNSKHGIIYKKCTCCGIQIGITTNIKGDVVVWDKSKEHKL